MEISLIKDQIIYIDFWVIWTMC